MFFVMQIQLPFHRHPTFGPLALSIGIVNTEVIKIESYSQLASIACEVKKAAKLQPGSSIARDRRLMG
jgi:hypothetical protein